MVIKVKQLLLRLGIVLAFLILFAGLFILLRRPETPQTETLPDSAEGRAAWLNLRGWQVGEPEISEAVMPEEWLTPNGQSWLKLQHAQGIRPEQYAGAAITRCRYPLKNGTGPEMYAELLLCENALAGAVVYDAETQLMRPVR
ncbi:MAG: DUF4830 domain-containing protein [Oscillospiraceae bacterium]|nr:DUF4830 domain-containing protein [Oscillospiraceae bacterium]MBQ5339910.1 DUF4830 domain-containing protein [Oscillospiraceae bacterium]MBQ9907328.1 DUF4830 domain-containing protein [Oscillospiraceae bacterium]